MSQPIPEIDVTLVAGCRPDLLAVTLDSFGNRVFRHFRVARFIANVDPIFGTAAGGDACARLIRSHFPDAEINRPLAPGFGQAVKSVWQKTGDRIVLHLEDDWRALDDITPDMIIPRMRPEVGMVTLAQKPRGPDEGDRVLRTRRTRVLGLALTKRTVNGYGTSPRFLTAGLAARYGALLLPDLDPEKQVVNDRNLALSAVQEKFSCLKVWRPDSGPLIEDLGRDWLRARDIHKTYSKSAVSWA